MQVGTASTSDDDFERSPFKNRKKSYFINRKLSLQRKGLDVVEPRPTCSNVKNIPPKRTSKVVVQHTCGICKKTYSRRTHLRYHVDSKHRTDPKKYDCEKCGKQFAAKTALSRHRHGCGKPPRSYCCQECDITCRRSDTLKYHVYNTHENAATKYVCEKCGNVYGSKRTLRNHLKRCGQTPQRYTCGKCEKTLATKSSRTRHYMTHHARVALPKKYKCENCGKCYNIKASMLRHSRKCVTNETLVCFSCSRKFARKDSLRQHMFRMHVGAKRDKGSDISLDKLKHLLKDLPPAIDQSSNETQINRTTTIKKKELALKNIHEVLTNVKETVQNDLSPIFQVREGGRRWENCEYINGSIQLKQNAPKILIQYDCNQSRAKFMLMIRLLLKMYSMLKENVNSISTLRQTYYELRKKETGIDTKKIHLAMYSISEIIKVEPWYLPIVATSTGLVYGELTFFVSKNKIKCNTLGGTLIPQHVTAITKIESKASFLLVVESDAVFKQLLNEVFLSKFKKPFILVTGKGYPTINVRLFVRKLLDKLKIPAYILVDGDVDGITIMLTYKFGSKALAHVNDHLAIPELEWLGVRPSYVTEYNLTSRELGKNDRKEICDILSRPYENNFAALKSEINVLLREGRFADIEDAFRSETYIDDKLFSLESSPSQAEYASSEETSSEESSSEEAEAVSKIKLEKLLLQQELQLVQLEMELQRRRMQ